MGKQDRSVLEGLPWPVDDGACAQNLSARSAVQDFLKVDASERLGTRGIAHLQEHSFFQALDWEALRSPEAAGPPFEASLGFTIERATRAPQRPRRGQRCLGP